MYMRAIPGSHTDVRIVNCGKKIVGIDVVLDHSHIISPAHRDSIPNAFYDMRKRFKI